MLLLLLFFCFFIHTTTAHKATFAFCQEEAPLVYEYFEFFGFENLKKISRLRVKAAHSKNGVYTCRAHFDFSVRSLTVTLCRYLKDGTVT